MRLTIIPSDGAVYKNGLCYSELSWEGTPDNVHALQWDENTGHVEFIAQAQPNETINELPLWALNAVNAWQTVHDEASNYIPDAIANSVITD